MTQVGMTCQQAREIGHIAARTGVESTLTIAWQIGGTLVVTVTPANARTVADCEQHTIARHGAVSRVGGIDNA